MTNKKKAENAPRFEGYIRITEGFIFESGRSTILSAGLMDAYEDDALAVRLTYPLNLQDGKHDLIYPDDYNNPGIKWGIFLAGHGGEAKNGNLNFELSNSGRTAVGKFTFNYESGQVIKGILKIKRFD